MSDYPSKPFSSGTEYEIFKYNYCEICRHHKIGEDGFPALVEDGGCPIEDAMEYARFDISMFPNKMIREIRNNDKVEKYHHCLKFEPNEQLKEQNSIIDSLKPKCSNEMPNDIVCNCTKESNK